MGLAVMILGLILFLGAHTFITRRELRAAVMDRIGRGPYLILFSIVSVLGIVLIVWGFGRYRQTGWVDVWYPPAWTRHIAVALMWPSIVALTAAYLPGYIKRTLKHPMLAAVKLWATAHLIANGDLGSIILFGSFLVWAIYDRIAVKRREASGEVTNVAIVGGWTNDAVAVVLGTFLYFAIGYTLHPFLVGVPAFSRAAG